MIVIRIKNEKYKPDQIKSIVEEINEITNEKVIVIPQEWDILFNCTIYDVYDYIFELEKIIEEMRKIAE